MTCPKCKSTNVSVQVVTESKLKTKHHNIIWWIIVGWLWIPVKWVVLTIPALLAKIFIPKRQKLKQKHVTMCVCQNCGHSWKA